MKKDLRKILKSLRENVIGRDSPSGRLAGDLIAVSLRARRKPNPLLSGLGTYCLRPDKPRLFFAEKEFEQVSLQKAL